MEFKNTTDSFGRLIKSAVWNFGDIIINTLNKTTQCVFSNAGKFKVSLTITNEDGCSETRNDSIIVYDKPVAKFTVNNDSQCLATNAFSFTNVSTPIKALKHEWNYGVGALDTMKVGYKKYSLKGNYRVKLIERLGILCSDSIMDTVTVLPMPVDITVVGKSTTLAAQDTFNAVVAKNKSTYNWVITGCTKLSGGTTSQIIIKWNTPPVTASIKVTETDSFGCVGVQKSKSVTVQKPASVEKYNDNGFELFPNPSSGIIHLNVSERIAKNATFSLYNSVGQLIQYGIQMQNGNTIDLSHLPKGLYTLSVISNGEFRSKKFVLQ
jgi:PKD repeat protein